jgi:hypothetical protein
MQAQHFIIAFSISRIEDDVSFDANLITRNANAYHQCLAGWVASLITSVVAVITTNGAVGMITVPDAAGALDALN